MIERQELMAERDGREGGREGYTLTDELSSDHFLLLRIGMTEFQPLVWRKSER